MYLVRINKIFARLFEMIRHFIVKSVSLVVVRCDSLLFCPVVIDIIPDTEEMWPENLVKIV